MVLCPIEGHLERNSHWSLMLPRRFTDPSRRSERREHTRPGRQKNLWKSLACPKMQMCVISSGFAVGIAYGSISVVYWNKKTPNQLRLLLFFVFYQRCELRGVVVCHAVKMQMSSSECQAGGGDTLLLLVLKRVQV